MLEDDRVVQPMDNALAPPDNAPASDFQEVRGRTSVIAFLLGTGIIAASISLGRSYVFFLSFLAFSMLMTLLWRKYPRPWIFLASISAATPLNISKYNVTCNLIFAIWFAAFNPRYLFQLPKWIYVPSVLIIMGILTSSINWMSGILGGAGREGIFAINLFLGPFLLLPVLYMRMRESRDHVANLQGLLFCLIVPSTVILISAKLFGTVANEWEASLHAEGISGGFFLYQFGKVFVNFLRTEVGFILAALICASTAVTISQVKGSYRLIAAACLASNAFLLLATGSFGSGFACLCGLAAIFFAQFRAVNATKVLMSIATIGCMLLLVYSFAPPNIKDYLGKRYEHRVTNANDDRIHLWARAVEHFFQHPEGVGWTLSVGKEMPSFIHNDYLVYAVSYGIFGGLAYLFLVLGVLIFFFRIPKGLIDDPYAFAIYLAGRGVIVALALNSITDHSNENRWYFNVIWSVIWYCYFCSQDKAQTDPCPEEKRSETGALPVC